MKQSGLMSLSLLALLALGTSTTVLAGGPPIAGCPPGFIDEAFDLQGALDYKGELPPPSQEYFEGYFAATDRNGDGLVCMKDLPDTPGIPSFATQLMDNVASS